MNAGTNQSILTPLNYLRRSAAVYPDKTAVVYGQTTYSYRQFNQRVNSLASALRDAGLEHLDRVAILCPNTPPMLEAHFGVPLSGGVLVAINTRLSPREIAYIINHSGARFLLVDSELADSVRPVLGDLQQGPQLVRTKLDSVVQQAPVQLLREPPVTARFQPPYPGGITGDEGFRENDQPGSLVGGVLH